MKRALFALAATLLLTGPDARATTSSSSPECGGTIDSTTLDPTAMPTSFGAGSLVIPMDSCYNPDNPGNSGPKNVGGSCGAGPSYACYNNYGGGNDRLPFGLLYLLAENDIPVGIILNQTKTALNEADFSITPPSGSSKATVTHLTPSATGYTVDTGGINCGTNTVNYSGMPFVVEASFAAQALQVITAFDNANSNLFTPVTFHVSNYPFTAPVLAVMASRPKPVLIDASPLDTFFGESGITSVAATGTTFLWLSGSGTQLQLHVAGVADAVSGRLQQHRRLHLARRHQQQPHRRRRVVVEPDRQPQQLVVDGQLLPARRHRARPRRRHVVRVGLWRRPRRRHLGQHQGRRRRAPSAPAVGTSASNPLTTAGPSSQYPASNRFLQLDESGPDRSRATAAASTARRAGTSARRRRRARRCSRTATATKPSPVTRWSRARRRRATSSTWRRSTRGTATRATRTAASTSSTTRSSPAAAATRRARPPS